MDAVEARDRLDSRVMVVTPEMIEAGFVVLSNSGITDEISEADKLLVEEIFAAMLQASESRSELSSPQS